MRPCAEAEKESMSTRAPYWQVAIVTLALVAGASARASAQAAPTPAATRGGLTASDDERPPPVEVESSRAPARGARQHDGLLVRAALGPSYSKANQDVAPAPIPRPTGPGSGLLPNLRTTGSGSITVSGEGLM